MKDVSSLATAINVLPDLLPHLEAWRAFRRSWLAEEGRQQKAQRNFGRMFPVRYAHRSTGCSITGYTFKLDDDGSRKIYA
jgi:hypothetical protein